MTGYACKHRITCIQAKAPIQNKHITERGGGGGGEETKTFSI